MFAVLRTGGKQYRVEPGAELDIEKITGEVGETVDLTDVLLVSNDKGVLVGQPVVDGAKITAEIVAQKKGSKLIIFKKHRRQGYHLKKGHRQQLTRIKITDIQA